MVPSIAEEIMPLLVLEMPEPGKWDKKGLCNLYECLEFFLANCEEVYSHNHISDEQYRGLCISQSLLEYLEEQYGEEMPLTVLSALDTEGYLNVDWHFTKCSDGEEYIDL